MYTYRCTRAEMYPKNSLGYKDVQARQGYYIKANNYNDAWKEMKNRFPGENHFDVQVWKV